MYELLQKLGVPAGIAGLIGALIIMVPFIFKIDERYAKAEKFQEEIRLLEEENQKLRVEISQLAGFQQTMLIFMNQNGLLRPINPDRLSSPLTTSRPATPPVSSVRPVEPAPVEEPPKSNISNTKIEEVPIERPKSWKELNEGLARQQERLQVPLPRDLQTN